MEAMFTTGDGPGKHYMVVASAEEWTNILMDLRHGRDWYELEPESEELIEKLKGWNL